MVTDGIKRWQTWFPSTKWWEQRWRRVAGVSGREVGKTTVPAVVTVGHDTDTSGSSQAAASNTGRKWLVELSLSAQCARTNWHGCDLFFYCILWKAVFLITSIIIATWIIKTKHATSFTVQFMTIITGMNTEQRPAWNRGEGFRCSAGAWHRHPWSIDAPQTSFGTCFFLYHLIDCFIVLQELTNISRKILSMIFIRPQRL